MDILDLWLHGWILPNSQKRILFFLKFFQKAEEKATFINLFSKTSITLMPKPDKDTTGKENYTPVSLINIDDAKTSIKH